MTLKDILESYLKEDVQGLKPESGNWYTIVRVNKKESSRYGLIVCESNKVKVFDRKKETTETFDLPKDISIPKLKTVEKDYHHAFDYIKYMLSKGSKQKHEYHKGLDSFVSDSILWRVYNNEIIVPYTNFELYPKWIGAKRYPVKKSVHGSIMKACFHPHTYDKAHETWVLGEGFKECLIASRVIESANVLEVGGCGNMSSIIKQIPKEHLIYVMGENDSKDFYDELAEKFKHIKVTYPSKGKDFADQYLIDKDVEILSLQITGSSIEQKDVKYKPLGQENLRACIYSKLTKHVHKIDPSNLDAIMRTCYRTSGWEKLKRYDKQIMANKVFDECVRVGDYMSDYEFGIGLWKYKDNYYYNTGKKVYRVEKDALKLTPYEEVLNNDFLLVQQHSMQHSLSTEPFNPHPLEKAIDACDWAVEEHSSLFLGFLVQSLYAGAIDFRPTLWIMSDASTAGKSWLTSWIKENVLLINRAQESGKTSAAGLRQDVANFSGPVFIDEFGEKASEYQSNSREILEMLRTAVTGRAPIKLGTAEQTAIRQRIRFSAILSCIDGFGLLEEQDYERTIFVKLLSRDKDRFYREVEPLFKELEGKQSGFISYALKRFHLYQDWLPRFREMTLKDLKGHRFRGLASVLCGYAVFVDSVEAAEKIYEGLKRNDPEMFSSFYVGNENDLLDKVLNHLFSTRYTDGGFSDGSLKRIQDHLDFLSKFGFKLNKEKTKLYIEPKLTSQFLKTVKFDSTVNPQGLSRLLKNSKYYLGTTMTRFIGSKKSYCLEFDVSYLCLRENENETV